MTASETRTTASRLDPRANSEGGRLHALLSHFFRIGLAGVVSGILFVGIGGRIVMRISGAINPDQAGAITDSENVVGKVTLDGTLTFIVFQGILIGFLLGIVWLVVREWMPKHLALRVVVAAVLAVLAGGSGIIDSGNVDFRLLEPAWLHIVMFLGLVALAGGATAAIDRALEGHIPEDETASAILGGLAGLGLLVGLPFLLGFYFVPGAAQQGTPAWLAGIALVAAAGATLTGWVSFYRFGSELSTSATGLRRILGYGGVTCLGLFGGAHLLLETSRVL